MTILPRTLAALLVVAVCLPALAQDKPRPRDSGGVIVDLSAWHSIETHEFMLNIVDLPDAAFARAQRRVRDKAVSHERIRFDDGEGWMFVEHIPAALYNIYVTQRMQSGEGADRLADRFWKHRGEPFATEEKRKIYTFGERAGWVYATLGRDNGRVCIFARIGLLSDWSKMSTRTREHYDTGISYRDCSGKRSLDAVATWLNGAKLVSSTYNRTR